jgi:nitrite reductase/ring-hydroxylating ferredoxin subunit
MTGERELDVERVICRLSDIEDPGSRGFTMGRGDWPLRGLVVRVGEQAWGYVNRCPHAGHPLNLGPNRFLTPGRELILCSSHGALFDRQTGFCIAGPCTGQSLQSVPLKIEAGFVMLADGVDPQAYADRV